MSAIIQLSLHWHFGESDMEDLPLDLIRLLDGVGASGNLQAAARTAGLSYRHAWGMIKHWEQRLGCSLLALERGRGSDLTAGGELLRTVWHDTEQELQARLEQAAVTATDRLRSRGQQSSAPLPIAASHGFGMVALVDLLRAAQVSLDLRFVGSEEALKQYAKGECEIAGFHVPQGVFGQKLWTRFQRHLDLKRDVLLLVETRELGFITRRDLTQVTLAEIARKHLRFLNRQAGSGSRLVFDLMLSASDLTPAAITGYHTEEYTHLAVAAVIAGGAADVGFGVRAAAEKFALAFWPTISEKYLIVARREALARAPGALVQRLLRGQAYKRLLAAAAGSDARATGKLIEVKHVPALLKFNARGRAT